MVDALSDPITDHFGRQLLHWLVGYSSSWYLSLGGSEFIDNFKKLESGASILEQGLGAKFDEEDEETIANDHRASVSSDRSNRSRRVNQERAWRFIRRDDPIVEYGERNYENLMLVDIMENCEEGVPGKNHVEGCDVCFNNTAIPIKTDTYILLENWTERETLITASQIDARFFTNASVPANSQTRTELQKLCGPSLYRKKKS